MPVFDATALLHFLEPDAKGPLDPETGKPVTGVQARINFLIRNIEAQRETIIIPAPALSEVLVHAGEAGPEYLAILGSTRCFRIEPFDQRAAVELAAMTRDAIAAGDLRAGMDITRAKLKFDRQIIAIARTQRQTTIYSDDNDLAELASALGIEAIPVHSLPLPPEEPQRDLPFEPEQDGSAHSA